MAIKLNMSFRLLATIFVMLLINYPVGAQESERDTLARYYPKRIISKIEFLVGANLIYVTGSDFLKESRVAKFGVHSTLGLIHNFSPRLSLDLKLSYESKGIKYEVFSENPGPPATDKLLEDVTLNYATATLIPRYLIVEKGKIEVGLGPYVGYLLDAKQVQKLYYKDALVSRYSTRPDPYVGYKEFDLGLSFLVASNVTLKERTGLTFQFIYSLGITGINKPTIDEIRNNTFCLLVGYYRTRKSYP